MYNSTKKTIYGFDLLKYISSLLVISIHTKAFSDYVYLKKIMMPIVECAVPVFFVLSSFFVFKKIHDSQKNTIKHYCRRIGLLYLFWFIVNLPLVFIYKRHLFDNNIFEGVLLFIKDIFFSYTFPGSWFLSASLLSIIISSQLHKYIHSSLILLFALVMYLYVYAAPYEPLYLRHYRHILECIFRPELNLTVFRALIWTEVGYHISNPKIIQKLESLKNPYLRMLVALLLVCMYVIMIFVGLWQILILIFVPTIICLSYILELRDYNFYKKMRTFSIYNFFLHFMFVWCFDKVGISEKIGHLWSYVLVVLICSIIAQFLYMNKDNYMLKYSC